MNKETQRILLALASMYAQYCNAPYGHDFMSAGELAIEVLEDYGLATEDKGANELEIDKLEALQMKSTPDNELASNAGIDRPTIKDYVEAAYLHGLCVENLDTGELEPPRDISDTEWITKAIEEEIARQVEPVKQEFRDKFIIDPTKKYHVLGTEKAIIITEWKHYKQLQNNSKESEKV